MTTTQNISAETESALCTEYQAWAKAQGLPAMSAEELLHETLTTEQRRYVTAFSLRWEAMLLAQDALPINDDEWGSERQIDAQNDFFEAVEKAISTDRFAELENYCHKANVSEMIAEGLKTLRGAA